MNKGHVGTLRFGTPPHCRPLPISEAEYLLRIVVLPIVYPTSFPKDFEMTQHSFIGCPLPAGCFPRNIYGSPKYASMSDSHSTEAQIEAQRSEGPGLGYVCDRRRGFPASLLSVPIFSLCAAKASTALCLSRAATSSQKPRNRGVTWSLFVPHTSFLPSTCSLIILIL